MSAFDLGVLEAIGREREVELTTWGRKSGNPSRVIIWIFRDGDRVFIRSGGGLGRDWPRNLVARGKAVLHVAGYNIAVAGTHVEDPSMARHVSGLAKAKYQSNVQQSKDGEPLTNGESATFELSLDDANA
jgi:hypothetical protein